MTHIRSSSDLRRTSSSPLCSAGYQQNLVAMDSCRSRTLAKVLQSIMMPADCCAVIAFSKVQVGTHVFVVRVHDRYWSICVPPAYHFCGLFSRKQYTCALDGVQQLDLPRLICVHLRVTSIPKESHRLQIFHFVIVSTFPVISDTPE